MGLGVHFLDSGPLLCLGGSSVLADLYDDVCGSEARVVEAVAKEIERRASARTLPGDPKRRGGADDAFRGAARRYRTLLDAAEPRPDPVPEALLQLESEFRALAESKDPGKVQHPTAHRGESESIHAAMRSQGSLVSCDDDAGRVAQSRGVYAETVVDLARRFVREQKVVKPRRIFSELQTLVRNGVDIGDVVQSALDLTRAP